MDDKQVDRFCLVLDGINGSVARIAMGLEANSLYIELVKRCELTDCGQLQPLEAAQAMKQIILGTLKAHQFLAAEPTHEYGGKE